MSTAKHRRQARFRAGLMGAARSGTPKFLSDHEAMKLKSPQFTPWQVSASEALRDGDAVLAIAAYRLQGDGSISGHDEEKTLTGSGRWTGTQLRSGRNPDKSTAWYWRARGPR